MPMFHNPIFLQCDCSKDAQSKMNNSEEFLRKELANKYKDMGKKVDGFE